MKKEVQPTRFVILCQARTGSYLLVDLLGRFSDISCHGEVFKPTNVELAPWMQRHVAMDVELRERYPITFINRIYRSTPRKISGFKFFASHNPHARQYLLENRQIQKVILTRDHLETYVSAQRAKLTGEWVGGQGRAKRQSKSEDVKVRFVPEQFERHCQKADEIQAEYAACEAFTEQTFIRIGYAEVAQIEPVRELALRLGSRDNPESLVPEIQKQITKPLSDVVENYGEMQDYLAQTGRQR